MPEHPDPTVLVFFTGARRRDDMDIEFECKFLRPEELLKRWQCSEADLKYKVIEGKLHPLICVDKPEEMTDREGRSVFGPDQYYILSNDDLFGPSYANRGYLGRVRKV